MYNNIIEYSDRDTFWGAKKINEFELKGINALGRLLMELRQEIQTKNTDEILVVPPPLIINFRLLGENIGTVDMRIKYKNLSS